MLARGELSARELAEHYLKRIVDSDERLNAVVAIDPEARARRAPTRPTWRGGRRSPSRCSGCR